MGNDRRSGRDLQEAEISKLTSQFSISDKDAFDFLKEYCAEMKTGKSERESLLNTVVKLSLDENSHGKEITDVLFYYAAVGLQTMAEKVLDEMVSKEQLEFDFGQ